MITPRNPYTPGAGVTPRCLAGRDELIQDAQLKLSSTADGFNERSVIYYGLRGVGKTVLLNAVENICDDLDILCNHIEIKEDGNLKSALAISATAFANNMSLVSAAKSAATKLKALVQSFTTTWNPQDNTVSFSVDAEALSAANAGTGDLTNDLTQLLVGLGKCAKRCKQTVCFCIDEVQNAHKDELEALMTALHRINQLSLPVIFFCAGLPRILKDAGDAKSYSERLFEFIEVDALSREAAREAIIQPALQQQVIFAEDAVELIFDETAGYPYFIQELCATIWHNAEGSAVTREDVLANIDEANRRLDKSFFLVRYNRCTEKEREFLHAMVACGELPCTIANVAKAMKREVTSISPFRAKLIGKGLIYATSRGEIDFTVPRFDEFLKRMQSGQDTAK